MPILALDQVEQWVGIVLAWEVEEGDGWRRHAQHLVLVALRLPPGTLLVLLLALLELLESWLDMQLETDLESGLQLGLGLMVLGHVGNLEVDLGLLDFAMHEAPVDILELGAVEVLPLPPKVSGCGSFP